MNAITKIQSVSTSIATLVEQSPVVVLTDHQQRDAFYAHIQSEVDAFEPDLSTEKGRKAIASLAYKITRTKTAIDDAGKKLNEDARARINAVDAERRVVKEKLTTLAAQVRAPLTKWEADEEERVKDCRAVIDGIKSSAVVTIEDTAETVRARGVGVWNTAIDADRFGNMAAEANAAKDMAVTTLKSALARLTKEDADRAELDRLRKEAAEREERDRIEREAREAEERAAAEVKAAEAKRIADEQAAEARRIAAEKAEAERVERAKQEAAEAEQRKAQEEQAKRDREHAEQLAAERRRVEEIEQAAQAERDRAAKVEAARQAEVKRIADEQAARDADQAHRGAVMKAAKEAIMTCGTDEETAKKIVLLIRAGEVPNVTLRF